LPSSSARWGKRSFDEGEPSYSADGNKLVFTRFWGDGDLTNSAVGIRDLVSGKVTMLDSTKTDLKVSYDSQPSLSPDGSSVVYHQTLQTPTQDRPTGISLFVAATDDSSAKPLPLPRGSKFAADPDGAPDGSLIVFSTQPNREGEGWADFPGHTGILRIAPDGSNLTQVCDDCLPTPSGAESGVAPSWTSDGRILFWGYKSWALMNADGSDAHQPGQADLQWRRPGLQLRGFPPADQLTAHHRSVTRRARQGSTR